jgi:hypothetical protein
VFHNDRDVEFILFKRYIEKILFLLDKNLKYLSCEMISDYLFNKISKTYPNRDIKIEVSEDGENGTVYEYLNDKSESMKNKKLNEFIDKHK